MLRRCAENVERLISIDCSSPTSASTWSKTGSVASAAGGRRPDWCSAAARPSVFSATVLPPVFGPLTTSTRRSPSSRSIGTARRRVEQRMPRREQPHLVGDDDRRAAPAPRERGRARARGRARRSPRRASPARPRARPPAARARAGSARPPRARRSPPRRGGCSARRSRTARRTASAPTHDESWTTPGTLPRADVLTASTGRPPRSVTNRSCRNSVSSLDRATRPSSSVTRCLPLRSSLRRRRSAGEASSRRSEPSSSTARAIVSASESSDGSTGSTTSRSSGARAAASPSARRASSPTRDGLRDVAEVARPEHAVAGRVLRGGAHVREPGERRLGRVVEQRDALGRERLPARDLARVGGRRQLARELSAARALRRTLEPLEDRRKLQHGQGMRIHAGQCTEGRFSLLAARPGRAASAVEPGCLRAVSRFAARRSLRLFCAGFFVGFFGLS